jgi:D-alanyl-D-alanine carboxypeptidase
MLRILMIVSVAAMLLSLAPRQATAANDTALRASMQSAMNAYLAAQAQNEHISALSLSVSLPGEPANINLTAGRRSWKAGGPVAADDLWQIGSNTKAFTAVTLLQLEAEGKLTIDQTIGTWLPQYPAWKNVSIRRLLNMTSGIEGYDNVPAMPRAFTTIHRRWTPEQLIGFSDPIYPVAPAPTHGWDYSNTNYLLAGLIIERVTGHTYGDELRTRFFVPLGLTNTFYSPNVYPQSVTARMVSGYFVNTGPGGAGLEQLLGQDMRLCDMSWAGAAGGIVSTPEDVTKWVRALYKGDMLAPKQRRELMTLVSDKTGAPLATTSLANPTGFGLGVGQGTRPSIGTYWYYQGTTLGYRVIYVWLPKSDVVFAVGANSQSTTNHIGMLIDSVWAALHKAGET